MRGVKYWVAAIGCSTACAGTNLTVRVDPPGGASKAGFHAVVGPVEDRCVPTGPLDVTDATGVARITEEFCGNLQLVVAARDYSTERRVLDTCDVKFMQVDMHPAPAITYASDECSTAALRVLRIWLSKDANALRDELVNAEDLPLYQRDNGKLEPWQLVLEPSTQNAAECSVKARLDYDGGCEVAVRVDLLRTEAGWRLRGLQYPD